MPKPKRIVKSAQSVNTKPLRQRIHVLDRRLQEAGIHPTEITKVLDALEAEVTRLNAAVERWKQEEADWREQEKALKGHAEALALAIDGLDLYLFADNIATPESCIESLAAYRRDYPGGGHA